MISHVYDVTYGLVENGVDTIVVLDDSIVRGGNPKRQYNRNSLSLKTSKDHCYLFSTTNQVSGLLWN